NNQPDLPKEIIPVEDTETITPIQQTESMEVHHPHHVKHKKKWGEYLLEFFMLFLAVFLGFLAENRREHMIEKERAEHYAKSLYQDMVRDTANLGAAINVTQDIAFKIDTLRTLCNNKEIADVKGGAIYYYSRFAFRHWYFNANDATIEQLKNSGSLRYFANYELEDAIGKYDQSVRWLNDIIKTDHENLNIGMPFRFQLLYASIIDSVFSYTIPRPLINDFLQRNQPMVTYDKTKWTEYLNFTAMRGAGLKRMVAVGYLPALDNARQIISLLKKEYHLKD
ncbi:MAG TPA: hypothetical protein VK498_05340, partial [Ferruginibacter sp.]|nr:hypothetical protein [Ferruginibacter sp.]